MTAMKCKEPGLYFVFQGRTWQGAPKSDTIPIATPKPKMTRGRALLIRLLDIYRSQGYRHNLLEIKELMYFL